MAHKQDQTNRPEHLKRIEWLAYGLLALAISIASTWPYVTLIDTHAYADFFEADIQGGLWWFSEFASNLFRAENPFFHADLVWPDGQDLRVLLWTYLLQLLFVPFQTIANPILAFNLTVFCIMILNGLAAGWAAKVLTNTRMGAVTGLIVGATSAYAFSEAGSGRPEQALWGPVAVFIAGLTLLLADPKRRRHVWLCAVSLAIIAGIYPFYAYFLVIVTVIVVAPRLVRRRLDRATFWALVRVGGLSIVLATPLVFQVFTGILEDSRTHVAIAGTVDASILRQAAFALTPTCYLGGLGNGRGFPSAQAPILLAPVLLFAMLRGCTNIRIVAAIGLLGLVFASGPILMAGPFDALTIGGKNIPLPMAALDLLPTFERFWWPYRWLGVAVPAFAMCAAWTIAHLSLNRANLVLFAALCIVECAMILRNGPVEARPIAFPVPVPEVFESLAALPESAPIVLVPLARVTASRMGWQPFHRQPIDGGMAWQMDAVRSESYESRRKSVPLLVVLDRISRGRPAPHRTRDHWTTEETGGFEFVMLAKDFDADPHRMRSRLEQFLGPPVFEDEWITLWGIPGLAPPLPALPLTTQ